MKSPKFMLLLGVPAFFLAVSAQAHDPKEHMNEAQAPDCSAMKNMDHAKMDMEDPVMQAMMQKCMKDMHHDDNAERGEADHEHEQQDEKDEKPSSPEHQH